MHVDAYPECTGKYIKVNERVTKNTGMYWFQRIPVFFRLVLEILNVFNEGSQTDHNNHRFTAIIQVNLH